MAVRPVTVKLLQEAVAATRTLAVREDLEPLERVGRQHPIAVALELPVITAHLAVLQIVVLDGLVAVLEVETTQQLLETMAQMVFLVAVVLVVLLLAAMAVQE
jgi:hypothetical protein